MAEHPAVLLTVSGTIPPDLDEQVRAGRRPRADYAVMEQAMNADVIDVVGARANGGWFGRLLDRLRWPEGMLAWYCFRRRRDYESILTDGEHVGIPLAMLCRLFGRGRARHTMIVHILSVRKKIGAMKILRLAGLVDRYVVYCSAQQDFIHRQLGVPLERIALSTFMVDTRFFDPARVEVPRRKMICSAGLERRDYPTLMAAVDGLDVEVVIAAASPWSKRADTTEGQRIPPNVEIRRLDLFELRELYAASDFVVMPLFDVDFQAGITTILEAMSMERPVLCTRTPGQTDTIIEGETGRYVPQGDAARLREVILELLADADGTGRLGRAARKWAAEHADVERYAAGIADVVAMAGAPDG